MATVADDQKMATGSDKAGRVRTRLDPERRREQLLDAAESVFAGRDPYEVTFEQVADAAGVSRALVYNYFGDKRGLIAAVHARRVVDLDLEITSTLGDDDGAAADRLRRLIRAHLDFAVRHRAVVTAAQAGRASLADTHHVVDQARDRRLATLAERWGPTTADHLVARGVLALLDSLAIDRLDGDLDAQAAEDLAFALLWPGLSAIATSPFH